jgi:hypothetical protein
MDRDRDERASKWRAYLHTRPFDLGDALERGLARLRETLDARFGWYQKSKFAIHKYP